MYKSKFFVIIKLFSYFNNNLTYYILLSTIIKKLKIYILTKNDRSKHSSR